MKKHLVYYEGKKYQVVWTRYEQIRVYLCKGIFKIDMPLRYYKDYIVDKIGYVLCTDSYLFNDLDPAAPDYYIKQAEIAVKCAVEMQDRIKNIEQRENAQEAALKEWNGVIE